MKYVLALLLISSTSAFAVEEAPKTNKVPDAAPDRTVINNMISKMNCPNGVIVNENALFTDRLTNEVRMSKNAVYCNPL